MIQEPTASATLLVVIVIAVRALASIRGASGPPVASTDVLYTVDEGQTAFADSAARLPPFDYKGKTAFRVYYFTCDEGKTRTAAYLERLTPEARAQREAAKTAGKSLGSPGLNELEVRKPGANNPWVKRSDFAAASKVMSIPSSNGETPEPVLP